MYSSTINLYTYFNLQPPERSAGRLTCWVQQTSPEVSPCRKRPAILILPGGGYSRTSARESEPVALQFVARGYAAFVLEYSCAPLGFPVSLREASMAMIYIRQQAQCFEIDPSMVAAMGFSAGGHLCGTLGTMYDSPEVQDLGPADQIRPDGLGLCYPVAVSWGKTHEGSFENLTRGDRDLRDRLSLEKLVRPDMPPVFLWHTRDDGSVPCRNSLILACALEEAGVEFAFHLYRNGPHGLSTGDTMAYPAWRIPRTSWDVTGWLDSMVRFFAEIGFCVTDREETR